ncbi:hypothetical protein [Ascidiimonas sp. W6]|uniref:hypothetical protein n=1 Tax=Ascidiimonas meishanensis TaxID=3128903 RepID=UPI0030EE00B5
MKNKFLASLAILGLFASCDTQETEDVQAVQTQNEVTLSMTKVDMSNFSKIKLSDMTSRSDEDLQSMASELNVLLEPYGIELEKMEYFSADSVGRTVFFDDRGNKQLSSDYVPNDPRNLGGETVPYIVDGTQAITASGLNILPSLETVRNSWDAVTCSDGLTIPNAGISNFDLGFVSNVFFGYGGSAGFFPGVIVQAGVLPQGFFDLLGGGNSILGVTFTLVWTEDINEDGVRDVAIKEIYYNDAFNWQDRVATGTGFDFETVALHETGHALSQAHFGTVSITPSNGKIHFSPRALMNAGYSGVNRVVEKTDKAGHCSNWGNWPNN